MGKYSLLTAQRTILQDKQKPTDNMLTITMFPNCCRQMSFKEWPFMIVDYGVHVCGCFENPCPPVSSSALSLSDVASGQLQFTSHPE
eukprot:4276492-Amphidinium_carterae.1